MGPTQNLRETVGAEPPISFSEQSERACRQTRNALTWLLLISTIVQFALSSESGLISLLVAAVAIFSLHVVVRPKVLQAALLPALVCVGFNVAMLAGPLLFQTLYLLPIAYNLDQPVLTFAACALFQLSLLAALGLLLASSSLRGLSEAINRRLWSPLGVMRVPTQAQLWLMGGFGVAVILYGLAYHGGEGAEFDNISGKFLAAFRFLVYAPLLIPLLPLMQPGQSAGRERRLVEFWALIAYLFLVVALAIASNSRSMFAFGLANVGILAVLLFWLGRLSMSPRASRWLAFGAVAVVLVNPFLVDLATAMVVARAERDTVSATELFDRTLQAYADEALLKDYRIMMSARYALDDYEEDYQPNPFLNRLLFVKYVDNELSLPGVRDGSFRSELWPIVEDKLVAILPTPALRLIGSTLNKADMQYSLGDVLYYLERGIGLGGFRVTTSIGSGIALTGVSVFVWVIPAMLVAFVMIQTLTRIDVDGVGISPFVFLFAVNLFQFACRDLIVEVSSIMVRDLTQSIILYVVSLYLSGLLAGAFSSASRAGNSGEGVC